MSKRIIALVYVLLFLAYTTVSASAVGLTYDGAAYPSNEPIFIENGVAYVSARALLDMRGEGEAEWDGMSARFMRTGLELVAHVGADHIIANETNIELVTPTRLVAGRVCIPVRALATALGASVEYDAHSSHITLTTRENYIGQNKTYTDDELYWMSRIIHSESCGEPYIGKLLVGEVVLNRKSSASFPNTVYNVIFDTTNGVQFTPTANGTVYLTPCDECTQAAKAALMGAGRLAHAMYFVNMSIVPISWVSQNRPVIGKYGSHTFFA